MYNRFYLNFVTFITKFYSNVSIQHIHKVKISQFKIPMQVHVRNYCKENPSKVICEHYNKLNEEELKTLLEDPKYKAIYDRYNLELEYIKYNTGKVPKTLTSTNWLHLLKSSTKGQRRSYIEFLWKIEMKQKNRLEKKLLQNEKEKEVKTDDRYGIGNSLFFRIRDKTMNEFYNSKLISAMLHEPIIVYDLGYDEYMEPFERENCAKQLLLSFSTNRIHEEPFNLYFCNVNNNSSIMQKLHKLIPQIYEPHFPLNITSKSYLEIFDKKQLVYLTPNAKTVLKKFDPNLIYIIGGIVDKKNSKPYSFQKANKEGIKMMKLPLSETLEWGTGSSKKSSYQSSSFCHVRIKTD
uniref:RNA (guanine-9-)-methyltransferase domain-containing protein 1 n=1 Tax=Apis cerana TaxID=7461 RepID=V9IJT1_APICE